jgi:hypothetical protein
MFLMIPLVIHLLWSLFVKLLIANDYSLLITTILLLLETLISLLRQRMMLLRIGYQGTSFHISAYNIEIIEQFTLFSLNSFS